MAKRTKRIDEFYGQLSAIKKATPKNPLADIRYTGSNGDGNGDDD